MPFGGADGVDGVSVDWGAVTVTRTGCSCSTSCTMPSTGGLPFCNVADPSSCSGLAWDYCSVPECTCTNGAAVGWPDCPANGAEACAACSDGYVLVGNVNTGAACIRASPICTRTSIHIALTGTH